MSWSGVVADARAAAAAVVDFALRATLSVVLVLAAIALGTWA